MKINELIENEKLLNEHYENYIKRKLIIKSSNPNQLKLAHLNKSQHNLEFLETINNGSKFDDWKIVTLYYVLYHSFLALVENKGYSSKNHNATVIFILKCYVEIDQKEVKLLERLKISEKDAMFYTSLKEKRNLASYSTETDMDIENIDVLIKKVKEILFKIELIIKNE